MAKFNVTRKDALNALITFARDNDFDNEEVLTVVDHMLNQLSSKTPRSGETRAHKANAKLLSDNLYLFNDNAVLTAREFANSAKNFPIDNNGRPSIHKATAVLVQGINDHILVRVTPEKKSSPMQYALNVEDFSIDAD